MKSKKEARSRRAAKVRRKIRELGIPRLCVHRTPRHIYAQLISIDSAKVLASASTLDKEYKAGDSQENGVNAAVTIGKMIAQRSLAVGVKKVAFDRSGYRYHGRIKALADSAREGGLEF